ncbi:DUF86 domain-containing protein [Accumulibacter sp.]|uniref:HepT-like ribonuclease domain-containing protein n=1 Tax=Accumulibacter sp. TaxID=2053492 RepID=UPI002584C3A5|nr:DUF86 domain-containing protein [Accumulibacter sp.]
MYLLDIVQAADSIAQFVAGMEEEQFVGDDLVRSAVLHKLAVIGEAAARVSSELKHSYPGIPWADIVGFRNIAVHAYFSVDWRLVWNAAVSDAPMLKCDIEAIVKARHVPQMQVKPGR